MAAGGLKPVIIAIDGARRASLRSQLNADRRLVDEVRRAAAAAGIVIAGKAKARAPRMTGRMANSIVAKTLPAPSIGVAVGTNVRAAPSRRYPAGYIYPARQEYDTKLRHSPPVVYKIGYTRRVATKRHAVGEKAYRTVTGRRGGEAGFLRKALAEVAVSFGKRCALLLEQSLRRMSGA